MDLGEIGCEDGRWMELAQDRVQLQDLKSAVMNDLRISYQSYLLNYLLTGIRF
jgi:hypothetical protein